MTDTDTIYSAAPRRPQDLHAVLSASLRAARSGRSSPLRLKPQRGRAAIAITADGIAVMWFDCAAQPAPALVPSWPWLAPEDARALGEALAAAADEAGRPNPVGQTAARAWRVPLLSGAPAVVARTPGRVVLTRGPDDADPMPRVPILLSPGDARQLASALTAVSVVVDANDAQPACQLP